MTSLSMKVEVYSLELRYLGTIRDMPVCVGYDMFVLPIDFISVAYNLWIINEMFMS